MPNRGEDSKKPKWTRTEVSQNDGWSGENEGTRPEKLEESVDDLRTVNGCSATAIWSTLEMGSRLAIIDDGEVNWKATTLVIGGEASHNDLQPLSKL